MSRLTILDDRADAQADATASRAPEPQAEHPIAAERPIETEREVESVREHLTGATGRRYWRSLEQLADTPGFRTMLEREFPRFAAEWTGDLDRRRFMQLSGASLALAGLAGCTRQPYEEIVPYVRQPEHVIPGRPLFFATGIDRGGYAVPVLAETHLGRPTKLDGNPESSVNYGKSDVFTQATILDLYDPDRLQAVRNLGTIRTWKAFGETITNNLTALRALQGEGLRILSGPIGSPTVKAMIDELLESMPLARWHRYDTLGRDQVHQGTTIALGAAHDLHYALTPADVVVAVGAQSTE